MLSISRKTRKIIFSLFSFLLLLFLVFSLLPQYYDGNSKVNIQSKLKIELLDNIGNYDSNKIILQNTNKSLAANIAERLNAKLRITNDGNFAALTLKNGNTILDVVNNPDNKDILKYITIDYKATLTDIDNQEEDETQLQVKKPNYNITDPLYNKQSYLDYINLSNIWNYTKGSGITVAVIDTGIDYDHPEFEGKISPYSYNATEDKIVKDYTDANGNYDWSLVDDEQGHGTAVTGVIAAGMNNGIGITGIAPNVTIITIKVECDNQGRFYNSSDLVFGLYYAIERDVNVVNMSFGGPKNIYSEATKLAVDSDIICVAAAGNEATSALTYPAADPNVIGVGALAENSFELARYSNYGENVNIVAPGTVYTTLKDDNYGVMNGTSFASPIVASIIALQMSKEKYNYTYLEFQDKCELLYAASYDLGDKGNDFYYGYGAIDTSAFILEERKTVTFNYLTEEISNTTQVFIKGHPLQNIPEPERNYAIFDGWYYDIHCLEEYNLYSDAWVNDIILYCNWVNEDDGVPYTYVELDDGTIEIRSYTGKRRYITIPDYIDEKKVSSIGSGAFSNQTRLRVVNLPNQLKTIKSNAFSNCSNLTSIDIPDSVTSIGASAFKNNIRLYNVNFNSTSKLETIDKEAFSNCSSLVRFDVPINVSNINGTVFFGCTGLKQVNANKNSKYFTSVDGILFNKSKTSLILYPAGLNNDTYDLPDTVKKLDIASFAYSNIRTIDLKEITSIEDYTFFSSNIESAIIPNTVINLGECTFYNSKISDITLGRGVQKISKRTFGLTNYLTEIIIPNNILIIDDEAFRESKIKNVIFEENSNLLSIGSGSFKNTSIKVIDLPNSVTSIGENAFSYSSLSNIIINDESKLTVIGSNAFKKTMISEINLPSNLQSIGSFAFSDTLLAEVNIPQSVRNLSSSAFASCNSLENIFIDDDNINYTDIDGVVYTKDLLTIYEYPSGKNISNYTIKENVLKVEDYAFYGSRKLNYIYLPKSLEEIGEYAFAYNSNLNSITIPDNVTLISRFAFYNDYSLTAINISNNSKLDRLSYASFASCGINSFTIPSNVSTISQDVFIDCPNLTSITFDSNSKLESISAYQFKGCKNLYYITFKKGSKLTNIQAHAFEGMINLRSIDFGDAKIENIDNYAFRYCNSLTNITLPSTVKNIGRFAFYECSSLSKITIPENIEFIGRYAFHLTNNLNVYFSSSILPLGLQENWDYGINGYYVGVNELYTQGDFDLAKLNNNTIAIIKYNGNLEVLDLTNLNLGNITQIGGHAFENTNIKEVILPSTINIIDKFAFANSSIKTINIPSDVIQINDYAFYNSSITNIYIEENSNLQKIGMYAFSLCDELKSFNIPSSVEIIGSYAFSQSGLEEVVFSQNINLTEISEGAFQGTKLISVNIPDSVTLINHSAFRDIETLKEVNFGTSKLQIMSNVFYNTGLTTVNIPANIEYIGEYAFVGLNNLNGFNVDINNKYYASVDGILYSKDLRKLIAFPGNKEGAFTVHNCVEVIGFGAFENTKLETVLFEENINLLTLGYRAFYNAKNLKQITIPESVVSIDYYAFAMCKSLETVTFSENSKLTGIYEGAFYGCINLIDIVIPDKIYEISDYAFYGCLQLQTLPISNNSELLGIYDYAFANSGIQELVLPESLLDIGSYAFEGIKVTNIVIPNANKEQLIIGLGAFSKTNNLEEITIPFIGAGLDDTEIGWFGYIFGAGSGEANIDYVPTSLKKVIITEGQTILPEYAFYNIPTLEEIDMPSTIKYLGINNMEDTSAKYSLINNVEPLYSNVLKSGMIGTGIQGKIILSDIIVKIEGAAFANCSLLLELEFSKNVTNIENAVFYECTSLNKVYYNGTIEDWCNISFVYLNSNPMYYANYIYMKDRNNEYSEVKEIKISDTLTFIGDYQFYRFRNVTNVIIPSSVTSIGEYAFSNCDSLSSVYYDGTIEDWCNISFVHFNSNPMYYANYIYMKDGNDEYLEVTEIEIPNTFTSIGDYQFYGFRNVTKLIIPNSITSIGDSVFTNCNSLSSIYYNGTIEDWCNISFEQISSNPMKSSAHFYIKENNNQYLEMTEIEIPNTVTLIGKYQFYGFSNVTKVTIPNSVTSIMDYAFSSCTSLSNVTIPNSVTSIGNSAFSSCTLLDTITIPNSVTSIGNSAFSGCISLKEVFNNSDLVFTPGNSSYGYVAYYALMVNNKGTITYKNNAQTYEYFTTEGGFKFLNWNDTYYLISYLGDEDRPVLPATVNGKTYKCQYMDKTLKDIELSNNFTQINDSMFRDCLSLETIVIPNTVKTIYSSAFYNCKSLKEITIPNSVTSIISSAFNGCVNLKIVYNYSNLNFEKGSQNHGYIAYYADEVVNYNLLVEYFVTEDGFKFMIFENTYYLISYLGTEERPIIPLRVNGFGYKCTYIDETLKHIELSSDFIYMNDAMFKDCVLLETIVIPNTVKEIPYSGFDGCTLLTNITIPNSVTSIGGYAFSGCTSLTNITIPDNVKIIGNSAFSGCTSLTNITIPDSVTSIESSAFSGCTSLTNITIPDNVKSIGGYAFYECTSLTEITISESVISIGSTSFLYCTSLENVYYNGTIENWCNIKFGDSYASPMYYSDHIYMKNQNNYYYEPSEIIIPDTITSIGKSQFYGFKNIIKVVISNSVTSIGDYSFEKCTSLQDVLLSNNITTIGTSVFDNCTSLESINIHDGVVSIGSYAFSNCKSLNNIVLSKNITKINSHAFNNCSGLDSVYYGGTIEDWCDIVFVDSYSNPVYYSKHFYMLDSNNDYQEVKEIEIPTTITSIGNYQFYGFDNVIKLVIPNSITTIGISAFEGCNFNEITIPENVTSIGNRAFSRCYNLKEVFNNSNLLFTIGNSSYGYVAYYASMLNNKGTITYKNNVQIYEYFTTEDGFKFLNWNDTYYLISYLGDEEIPIIPATVNGKTYKCTYMDETLKDIELSSDFTKINDFMFANNMVVESIVIPITVTSIGDNAFYNCEFLLNISVPTSVKTVGSSIVDGTAYYNDKTNWKNGALYLNHILLKVDENIEYYYFEDNITCIASAAFSNCYKLKYVEVTGLSTKIFNDCPNIETILFRNISDRVRYYFNNNSAPITLKNIILGKDCAITSQYLFDSIYNVNIYVDQYETDIVWNHKYQNWNNGNKVYYKGEWIKAKFYDENDVLLSSNCYMISQVIRQPIMDEPIHKGYIKKFIGWDIDGDGFADSLPATSKVDITAKAIYSIEEYTYTVKYFDIDGKTILKTEYYSYNDDLVLISNPNKKGYTFDSWVNYPSDLKVTKDINIYSEWTHNGDGHVYEETIVSPTCTEKGYTLHVCSICDEQYKDNYIDALGHAYSEWIIDVTPSCETEGLKHKECSECSHNVEEIILSTGHSYTSLKIKDATCEEQGVIKHICTECEDVYMEYTNLLPHNYKKKLVSKTLFERLISLILNIFYGYEDNKAYYYECTECKHILLNNDDISDIASVKGVCEHTHCEWANIIEPTCCEEGYKTYTCTECDEVVSLMPLDTVAHSEQIVTGYDSTYTQTGLTDGVICSECGTTIVEQEIIPVKPLDPNFKIRSAYVNLTQDINLIYRTTVPTGYENFYMIFTLNETEYKVSEYFIDENGRYCFAFKNIMPQYMGNNITARLYATVNNEEVYVEQASYSIKQYCVNLLNKLEDNETNKATRNVLSDLLEYGAAVQVYRNYNIDNLVTKDVILSSTVFNTLDESYNKQAFIGEASEEIKWHSAGLYLENTMSVRLGFKVNLTENINKEDLKVVVSINGRATIYNVSELEADADGVYRIYYRGVYAKEFNDVIEAYFLNKDVQIGNTLQYSVNTYIYKKQESSDEALVAIIKAIYNYGASTEEYDK